MTTREAIASKDEDDLKKEDYVKQAQLRLCKLGPGNLSSEKQKHNNWLTDWRSET